MTCHTVTAGGPSPAVLAAFGARGAAVLLPGGQGRTWRAGNVILKPASSVAETAWRAEVLSTIPESARFRVARPRRSVDGGWVALGWEAWHETPGQPDPRRWRDTLATGEAFHRALVGLPRPDFLDTRDDPWSYGDRVAWAELPVTGDEVLAELLVPLAAARRPVELPAQAVHGDLLGNVLFAGRDVPTVIDWPPYFRPAGWAMAVIVVDALTWHGAPASALDLAAELAGCDRHQQDRHQWDRHQWDQLVLRALMYRIATNEGHRRAGTPVRERHDHYLPAVRLLLDRLHG